MIQLNLKGPAEFITHTILRIPHGTILARYSKILLAFCVSGVMHAVVDISAVPITQSGACRFFCMQALGIMIEDGVQEVYRIASGNGKSRFGIVVGYIWVFAFFCWSTPAWAYPLVRSLERSNVWLTMDTLRPLFTNLW